MSQLSAVGGACPYSAAKFLHKPVQHSLLFYTLRPTCRPAQSSALELPLQVTPTFGLYVLESQLKINECARQHRRYSEQPQPQDVSDILPEHR